MLQVAEMPALSRLYGRARCNTRSKRRVLQVLHSARYRWARYSRSIPHLQARLLSAVAGTIRAHTHWKCAGALCNGTMRPIYLYKDGPDLTSLVEEFMRIMAG